MWVSELMPHTAKMVDDMCFIRSMHTDAINHEPAITFMQTGNQVTGRACIGSWVSYGLGSLNKTGTGVQTLSGANTYTGITTISAGILAVNTLADGGTSSGIGASTNADTNLVLDGGTLRYTGAAQTTDRNFTLDTSGGGFDASGSGALTLAGAATLAGTDAARTLTLTGSNTGNNTLAAALTDNGSGPTNLLKSGSGTWLVAGASSYTGSTTVAAGILRLGSANRIGDLSAVAVTSGATFDLNNFSDTVGSLSGEGNVSLGSAALTLGADNTPATFSGIISGSGSVAKTGTGTQVLSGSNTYSGSTTITGGILSVSTLANGGVNSGLGSSTGAATNLIINGGTLRYTGASQATTRNYTIGTAGGAFDASGTGSLTLTGAATLSGSNTARTLTLTGSNTANNIFGSVLADNGNGKTSLLKSGSGTWMLTGSNTYTGSTTISGGTLAIGNGGLTGSLGTTSTVVNNGVLNFNRSNDSTAGYAITGTGSVVKNGAGTLTLTGASSYSGTTTVAAGTLGISATGSLGATATTVAFGSTLHNDGTISGPVTVNGNLTGAGTFTGGVTINTSVNSGNSPGFQTFSSGLRFNPTSTLYWELANNTSDLGLAGSDYDQVRVTGGVLEVAAGASLNLIFNLVSSGVDFSNVFWTGDHNWSVVSLSGTGSADSGNASFTLASISADSLGHSYSPYGNFSTTTSNGNQVLNWTAVPEPNLTSLILIGSSLLLRRRREKN